MTTHDPGTTARYNGHYRELRADNRWYDINGVERGHHDVHRLYTDITPPGPPLKAGELLRSYERYIDRTGSIWHCDCDGMWHYSAYTDRAGNHHPDGDWQAAPYYNDGSLGFRRIQLPVPGLAVTFPIANELVPDRHRELVPEVPAEVAAVLAKMRERAQNYRRASANSERDTERRYGFIRTAVQLERAANDIEAASVSAAFLRNLVPAQTLHEAETALSAVRGSLAAKTGLIGRLVDERVTANTHHAGEVRALKNKINNARKALGE